jgi:hypothetical protein
MQTNFASTPPPPNWVKTDTVKTEGLDLLGLRLPAQTISNNLLTGITTISTTIRYLSLRAWIIYRYKETKFPDEWKAFYEFAAKIEAAIAIGNLLVDRRIGGLVGKNKAVKEIDTGNNPINLVALVDRIATSIYAEPSEQLRISRSRSSGIPALTEERGLPLAEVVEQILKETEFAQKIFIDPKCNIFSREELEELGRTFPINVPTERERYYLAAAIFPQNPISKEEINRQATYGILLELVNKYNRPIEATDLFNAAIATERLNESIYEEWQDGWLAYVVRDMLGVVHEGVLKTILNQMEADKEETASCNSYDLLNSLLSHTDKVEEVFEALDLRLGNSNVLDQPLEYLADSIIKLTQPQISKVIPRWNGLLETNVIKIALDVGVHRLALLPIAWLLARERGEKSLLEYKNLERLRIMGWGRFGILQVISPVLKDMLLREISVREAIFELAIRTVDQHLRIAWARLASDPRKDVTLLWKDSDLWYYKENFESGRTASRLREAISWLNQLQLINDNGCTQEGLEILRNIRLLLSVQEKTDEPQILLL